MRLFAWCVSVLIVVWWTLSSQTASAASCTSTNINFTSGDTLFVDACALGPVTLNMESVRRCENISLSLANLVIDQIVWPDCATSVVNVSIKLERCHVGEFGVLSVSSTLIRRVSVTLQNSEVNMTVTTRSPTKAYSIVDLVVRGTSAQAAMDFIDVRCLSTRVIREPPAVGLVSNISVVEPLFSLSGTRSPSAVTIVVDDSEFGTLEMLESRYKYLIWRFDFPLITSAVLTVTRSRFHHVVLPLRNGTTIALFQFVTTSATGTSKVLFTWRDSVVAVNASSLVKVNQPAEFVEVKLVLWGGPSTQHGCQWIAERIHADVYTTSEGHLFYLEYGTKVNASMVTVRDVELYTWRRGTMASPNAPIRAFVLIVGFFSHSVVLIEQLHMITDTSVEATQAVVSIVSANRFANSTVTILDSTSRMVALEGSPFTSGFTSSLIGITTVTDGASIVLRNVTAWNVYGPTVQHIGAFAAACVTIETCATCVIRLRNVRMTSNVANAFQGTLHSFFRSAASFLTFGAPPGQPSSSFTHSVVHIEDSTFAASEFFVDACTSVGYTNINVFNNSVRLHNVTSVSLPLPSSSSSAGTAVVPQLRALIRVPYRGVCQQQRQQQQFVPHPSATIGAHRSVLQCRSQRHAARHDR